MIAFSHISKVVWEIDEERPHPLTFILWLSYLMHQDHSFLSSSRLHSPFHGLPQMLYIPFFSPLTACKPHHLNSLYSMHNLSPRYRYGLLKHFMLLLSMTKKELCNEILWNLVMCGRVTFIWSLMLRFIWNILVFQVKIYVVWMLHN